MKLTIIITTYNWPESLLLVLDSIRQQTQLPDEIIIADDGSDSKTKDLITTFKEKFDLNIIHSWQVDNGFRAARSRNNAILKSSGDYIILIDGDVILHPKFVIDHLNSAEIGCFSQGTRVLLSEKKTKKILGEKKLDFSFFTIGLKNRKNSLHSKLLSLLFSNKKNHLNGVKSCNMAFYRKDCININGFNNDFEGWGREDSEFVVRLINSGILRKNIRFAAIQFHLWHNDNSRISLKNNDKLLDNAINNHLEWCENGINSIEKNES
jgi:glycosyltransferase involved in cell wall biosynthesis